ncbi:MAG: hypothetical protein VSS52_004795, partial [Thiotrichaceae bacterium]|nr:hypothetical protein [Thiotrichaceae bacterium]
AEPGQSAWGNGQYGGFFTGAFLNSLKREIRLSSNPSWDSIMKRAEAPIEVLGRIQNPQTFVSVNSINANTELQTDNQCDGIVVNGKCYSN